MFEGEFCAFFSVRSRPERFSHAERLRLLSAFKCDATDSEATMGRHLILTTIRHQIVSTHFRAVKLLSFSSEISEFTHWTSTSSGMTLSHIMWWIRSFSAVKSSVSLQTPKIDSSLSSEFLYPQPAWWVYWRDAHRSRVEWHDETRKMVFSVKWSWNNILARSCVNEVRGFSTLNRPREKRVERQFIALAVISSSNSELDSIESFSVREERVLKPRPAK